MILQNAKVIFIVNEASANLFSDFLNTRKLWWEYPNKEYIRKNIAIGDAIIIYTDSDKLNVMFDILKNMDPKILYFIDTRELWNKVDIIKHHFFINLNEWKDFNALYQKLYGVTFENKVAHPITDSPS